MILTGKAKEDFENGIIEILNKNYNAKIHDNKRAISWIYDSNDLILLAHIIEWFDSIGNLHHNGAVYNFKTLYLSTFKKLEKHHSILDIHKIIIEKANEIYNETTRK